MRKISQHHTSLRYFVWLFAASVITIDTFRFIFFTDLQGFEINHRKNIEKKTCETTLHQKKQHFRVFWGHHHVRKQPCELLHQRSTFSIEVDAYPGWHETQKFTTSVRSSIVSQARPGGTLLKGEIWNFGVCHVLKWPVEKIGVPPNHPF